MAASPIAMPPGPPMARGWARAIAFAVFLCLDVLALGVLPLPERLTAAIRSAVAPGLGLFPSSPGLAIVLLLAAFLCTWAWFRWGVSVPVIVLWCAAVILTVRLSPHTPMTMLRPGPDRSALVCISLRATNSPGSWPSTSSCTG